MSRRSRIAGLALALGAASAQADPALVEARGESLRLVFSLSGGDPVAWDACHPGCGAPLVRASFTTPEDPPPVRIGPVGDPDLAQRIAALDYTVERRDEAAAIALELRSALLAPGVSLRKRWSVSRSGFEVWLRVALEGEGAEAFAREHPLELSLATGRSFEPPPSFGFASLGDSVANVQVDGAGAWAGVRNRFWALLARSDGAATLAGSSPGTVVLRLAPGAAQSIHFYAGPVESAQLRAVDPALTELLFAHLWFWVRWLALGMTFLLGALSSVVGVGGFAVVLLAVCVKLAMRPLTRVAERWQREVNETRTRLEPGIAEIKASSRGAERSRRLLELHREGGVSPFFGLKSLFGVAVQIPFFFAAYHTLDESFALAGVSCLWIADLSAPDRFATLPFAIPFFGDALNLLPFLMTGATLAASRLHDDGSLAPGALRRQRLGLYAMALAFFALFYTFPSGMVLYWTSNNCVALVRDGLGRWLSRRRGGTWRVANVVVRR